MKKLVFALILTVCVYQLKAQQLQAKAADSLAKSINKYFKLQPDVRNLLKPTPNFNEILALNNDKTIAINLNTQNFRDNMPVIALEGNSKMPVARLDGYDNMPVKKINPTDANILQQKKPLLPPFKLPAILTSPVQKK